MPSYVFPARKRSSSFRTRTPVCVAAIKSIRCEKRDLVMYSPTPTDQVDVTTSVGARYPEEAPIAAIVMSTNSDRRALRAVDSLLKQDLKAQIVVVNTGHGSLHEVLKPVIGDIKLVE